MDKNIKEYFDLTGIQPNIENINNFHEYAYRYIKGIPFDCPKCGEKIQFGLSDIILNKIKNSKIFKQNEKKESN